MRLQALENKTAQILQGGRPQAGDVVQQVVVQLLTQLSNLAPHKTQIQHHAGKRIGLPAQKHFGVVGVAVNAQTAVGFDLTPECVRRVKKNFWLMA